MRTKAVIRFFIYLAHCDEEVTLLYELQAKIDVTVVEERLDRGEMRIIRLFEWARRFLLLSRRKTSINDGSLLLSRRKTSINDGSLLLRLTTCTGAISANIGRQGSQWRAFALSQEAGIEICTSPSAPRHDGRLWCRIQV